MPEKYKKEIKKIIDENSLKALDTVNRKQSQALRLEKAIATFHQKSKGFDEYKRLNSYTWTKSLLNTLVSVILIWALIHYAYPQEFMEFAKKSIQKQELFEFFVAFCIGLTFTILNTNYFLIVRWEKAPKTETREVAEDILEEENTMDSFYEFFEQPRGKKGEWKYFTEIKEVAGFALEDPKYFSSLMSLNGIEKRRGKKGIEYFVKPKNPEKNVQISKKTTPKDGEPAKSG